MATFSMSPDLYFVLENIGTSSALFSFSSKTASIFRVQLKSANGDRLEQATSETNFVGRLRVEDLVPGLEYTATGFAGEQQMFALDFRTLELPEGKPRARLAVVSDPHISLGRENRRGRLFRESAWLLRETLEGLSDEDYDAILIPGDVTDQGRAREVDEVARLLPLFQGEVFLVPGDHDTGEESEGAGSYAFAEKLYERGANFATFWKGLRVIGLDTSSGRLDKRQLALLGKVLSDEKAPPTIMISHHNLLKSSLKSEKSSAIENHDESSDLLLSSKAPWVAYSGHINIPFRTQTARGWQINCPQIVHYPAGYLAVEVYDECLLQQFVPIQSEILRNYSLRMLAEDRSATFDPWYRYGSLSARSFVLRWEDLK